jgi:hypothetical protein
MLIIQSVNINFNTHFQIIVVIFERMKDVCKFKFKCEWIHLYQFHSTIVILNASMIENNKIFDLILYLNIYSPIPSHVFVHSKNM